MKEFPFIASFFAPDAYPASLLPYPHLHALIPLSYHRSHKVFIFKIGRKTGFSSSPDYNNCCYTENGQKKVEKQYEQTYLLA